jgi:hypothetical protein
MENEDITIGSTEPGTQKTVTRVGDQLREKMGSSKTMESASKSIDRISMYLREKDSNEMLQDLQQVVRRHPGKSLVLSVLVGAMVGRVMR